MQLIGRYTLKPLFRGLILPIVTVAGLGVMSACNNHSNKVTANVPEPKPEASAFNNSEKPNFLFILTDDQTVNTINALGNSRIETPNIDKLVKGGMAFTHVYNQGSWSGAVCAASRRMINSGRHLFNTGLGPKVPGASNKSYPLMGEVLQKNGYETFMTGKWHLNNQSLRRSFSLGSAVFEGGMSGTKKGGQFHPSVAEYDGDDTVKGKLATRVEHQHSSELFTDAAIDYLANKSQRNDKPFFMYVAYLAPHDPRESPQDYVDMYPPETIDLPPNFMAEHPFDQGDHSLRDEVLLPFPRTETAVKQFIAEYYAMITHLDAQIGRLLNQLDVSGYTDNTVIIFTSDHGLAVGQHGLLGKQNQYDHSVRTPFIMKGPGIPTNKKVRGMFYLHSVFPTVLDFAGIDTPDYIESSSIMPLVRGEKEQIHDTIYGSYKHYQRMLTDNNYKLIYYPLLKKTQLFNVANDPYELKDLSQDPTFAERISSMHVALDDWKRRVGDPLTNDDPSGSYMHYFTKSSDFSKKKRAKAH